MKKETTDVDYLKEVRKALNRLLKKIDNYMKNLAIVPARNGNKYLTLTLCNFSQELNESDFDLIREYTCVYGVCNIFEFFNDQFFELIKSKQLKMNSVFVIGQSILNARSIIEFEIQRIDEILF